MSTYRLKPTSAQSKSNDFSLYLKITLLLVLAVVIILLCLGASSSQDRSQRRRMGENTRDIFDSANKLFSLKNIKSRKLRKTSMFLTGFSELLRLKKSYSKNNFDFKRGTFKGQKDVTMIKMTKPSGATELAYVTEVRLMNRDMKKDRTDNGNYFKAELSLKSMGKGRVCNREVRIPEDKREEFMRNIMDWDKLTESTSKCSLKRYNYCQALGLHVELKDSSSKSLKVVFKGKNKKQTTENIQRWLNISSEQDNVKDEAQMLDMLLTQMSSKYAKKTINQQLQKMWEAMKAHQGTEFDFVLTRKAKRGRRPSLTFA